MDQGGTQQNSGKALKGGAIAAAIVVLVLVAAVLLLSRNRNNADVTLDSSSRSTSVNPAGHGGTNKDGSSIGGAIPEADPAAPGGTGPRTLITLDPSSTTTTTAASTATTTKTTTAPTVVTPTNPPPTNTPTTAAPTTTPPTTSSTAVRIDAFDVAHPNCVSDPTGTQIKISWKTSNAVRVTISIDGPGVYTEYNMNHPGMVANWADDFPFACSVDHHTYLITVYAADNSYVDQTKVVYRS